MTGLARRLQEVTGGSNISHVCELLSAPHTIDRGRSGYRCFDAICQENGITVNRLRSNDLPYRGRFQWDENDDPIIDLRVDSNKERERFTFAHELGHWLIQRSLPERKETLFRGLAYRSNEHNEEESLANMMAYELLMPRQHVGSPPKSPGDFGQQCLQFGVNKIDFVKRHAALKSCLAAVVQIVPAVPDNQDSYAVIDYACIVTSAGKTIEGRNVACLNPNLRFSNVPDGADVELDIYRENRKSSWSGFTLFTASLLPQITFVSVCDLV